MARIHRVARAQQRYERVPVLDDNGKPKVTPGTNPRVMATSHNGRVRKP